MPAEASAYLVIRQEDGFGDVFALAPGERYTLGRANTNQIVLKDDVCSREHAEVFSSNGRWRVRDLKSLNGTRVNGTDLDSEWELSPQDEVSLGHTLLVFVEDMTQLPDVPLAATPAESVTIKKRLGTTRFLSPLPATTPPGSGRGVSGLAPSHTLSRDLALLYRLALDMGSATTYQQLAHIVLEGLLEAIPADAGAFLTCRDDNSLELTEHRHRDASIRSYVQVSQFLSREVMASKEAILAEDVARHPALLTRDSIQAVGASSLICAPVIFNDQVLALIHLYCVDALRALDAEDLEFVLAVARQLGGAAFQLLRQASLSAENQSLRDQLRVESELVGESTAIKGVERKIGLVAGTNATVLIRGESGTGKELVARAVHYTSQRKDGPFICLNCAALPEALLESELFGHEKGAFTGATEKKVGKFESAHRGTIFLDEIGELSPSTQAKLLRILEGHSFERVGGNAPIRVDVRVLAATNQPLEKRMSEGKFRKDLFFRLQVVEITIPPLRDRRSDVPILASHFLRRFVLETGRKIQGFSAAALRKMEEHSWPGNVRELRNVVERAVALGAGPHLDAGDVWLFSLDGMAPTPSTPAPAYLPLSLDALEKEHIRKTLHHTEWNKSQAATILQIERSTLDRKIKLYDIKR